MEARSKSCCSVFRFPLFCLESKISWKNINGLSVNAKNMWNTSIKTKRPAKNSNVAHSTRCKMISKSWMSARTKSHSAPRMAIQPERERARNTTWYLPLERENTLTRIKNSFTVSSNRHWARCSRFSQIYNKRTYRTRHMGILRRVFTWLKSVN